MMRSASPLHHFDIPFLEPPHSHDPEEVPNVVALPSSMMAQLPVNVQEAILELQESTSIAYASYTRLQSLLDERFERLAPSLGPAERRFSETSFFNYRNHLQAEKAYLLSDALPDWRHKATFTKSALHQYSTMSVAIAGTGSPQTVDEWWSSLQATVSSWSEDAKKINIPDFEDTVQEYLAGRHAAAVYDSEESTPLESPVNESMPSFASSDLTSFDIEAKDCTVTGKRLDTRKDSGVCIDD